ncbi:MAG: hypothetical protein ACP6IU_15250 [Candidatus Asgardarchaeia archaeon]
MACKKLGEYEGTYKCFRKAYELGSTKVKMNAKRLLK